jgi:hypothetical protein
MKLDSLLSQSSVFRCLESAISILTFHRHWIHAIVKIYTANLVYRFQFRAKRIPIANLESNHLIYPDVKQQKFCAKTKNEDFN